ncbi:histidine kinase [Polymorphospora rubra]|uniref:sensor histidine kinase n=1 Tax=Polymorphospora rubra TaxID=338584 RepID=UPI0033DFEB83
MNGVRAARQTSYGRIALVLLLTVYSGYDAVVFATGMRSVAVGIASVAGAVLLLRRRFHWLLAPLFLTAATGLLGESFLLPLLCVALFDLAADRRAGTAVSCILASLGINAILTTPSSLEDASPYLASALFMMGCVLGGLWRGSRRRAVQLLADQVEHLKVEASLREEAARIRERARIAAEMHDVLAHRLSLIALHTGVLAARSDDLPDRVADRLRLLRTVSTEALTDLREVLYALHAPEPGTDQRRPAIGQVNDLVDEGRTAGQRIGLLVEGTPEMVPTTHRFAVYRVVQEALTNARKHADGATVTVRVDYRPPATSVEVANTGGQPAPGAIDSGYGLVGLRERLTALGGRLQVGPAGGGSWRLTAELPHPVDIAEDRSTA